MTEVTVTNRRADSSANEDLTQLARHGADAFGYKANLRIDRKLAQLLRLRVSQINNCTYCLNLHYEAARDAGIPRPVIDTLTAWWETDFHDDAARAALAYTEAITRVADATVADAFGARHDAPAEHFSQEEILEIIGIVINMMSGPDSSWPRAPAPGSPRRRCREPAHLPSRGARRQRTRGCEHRRHGGHARWRLRAFSLDHMTKTKGFDDPITFASRSQPTSTFALRHSV
jgi:AhpD family alkylhydroperoxidase